jgi:trehalose/maltose hydrolase-like predicted phosphorylase
MSQPISPPPVTTSATKELPAYVSNGLIGLRVVDIPIRSGISIVNGFAGLHPTLLIEANARTPYPIAGDIQIDGVWLTLSPQQAEFVDQRYDFSTGELTTRFTFHANDVTVEAEVLTFCSRKQPTLVLQELSVRADRPCDLILRAKVDPDGIQGEMEEKHIDAPGTDEDATDGSMLWTSFGGKSRVGIAYVTQFIGDADAERIRPDWGVQSALVTDYQFRARTGRPYRLRQITSLVPDSLHHDPARATVRLAARAKEDGFDAIRSENHVEWGELWKGRVLIDTRDERWQSLADAAFFYLNMSVHPSAPASTSIYGLATWHDYHYYYGHVMWDVETFSVPTLLFSQPDAARTLLEFRTDSIKAARKNAKLHGRRGIQFPWEASPINGEECAPGAGKASWHEDHVSLDVARAFTEYQYATGDRRFLAEDASRVLYGVADWITSRVTRSPRGFEFKQAMGIAERKEPTDNDAFTILSAKTVLRQAIECAQRLGHSVPDAWYEVEAGLDVTPNRDRVILTHDVYRPNEELGATPGPLAAMFPVWWEFSPDVERATLDYYLRLAPEYIGSPMLSALYGVWAAWRGDRRLSLRLFDEGYAQLVVDRFQQTLEMLPEKFPEKPRSGPFFANLGGFLMGLMFGLPAIRLGPGDPTTWPSRPVVLPEGWRSIEIERAWVHQKPARIVAEHGAARAEIQMTKDERSRAA